MASSQGKRKINQLMADLDTVNQELDHLSHQEKDFAELQKKQELLKSRSVSSRLRSPRTRKRTESSPSGWALGNTTSGRVISSTSWISPRR